MIHSLLLSPDDHFGIFHTRSPYPKYKIHFIDIFYDPDESSKIHFVLLNLDDHNGIKISISIFYGK
jgi:hypothetical protein